MRCRPGGCLSVLLVICVVGLSRRNSAPKWRLNSHPAYGDSIIVKTDGSEVRLDCGVKGRPKPSITWYKDGQLFNHTQRKNTKLHRYSLRLNDVDVSDKGEYKCVVRNIHGELSFTFIVDIIRTAWPLELEAPQNQTVVEGERAEFTCRALNDPEATTKWLKRPDQSQFENLGPPNDFLSTRDDKGTLVIEKVTFADAGKYTCLVSNYFGIKFVDTFLTVIPKSTTTTTTSTTTTPSPTTTTTTPTTTTTTPTTTTTTTTTPAHKTTTPNSKAPTPAPVFIDDLVAVTPWEGNNYGMVSLLGTTSSPDNHGYHQKNGNNDNNVLNNKGNMSIAHIPRIITNDLEISEGIGQQEDMSVSVWTIYIIVGSVAGGVLLVGLVDIVVALSCNQNRKKKRKTDKHTSVKQTASGVP